MKLPLLQFSIYRVLSALVDFGIATIILGFFSIIWHLRPYITSYTDVIRIEAESLYLDGYQQTENERASGDAVIELAIRGRAEGKFTGPSGRYDIVGAFKDGEQGSGKMTITINNTSFEYFSWFRNPILTTSVLKKDLFIQNGSSLQIEGEAKGGHNCGVDYLEFIPTNSPAFRPTSSERAWRWRREYLALGYDDMNVHLFFLRVIPIFFLYQFILLARFRATPGMRLFGLMILHSSSRPNFSSSFRRQIGNFISLLTLGLGFLSGLTSIYRQTFGDIASRTFVISRKDFRYSAFAHDRDATAYGDSLTTFGSFPGVPGEYRMCAALIDIMLVASILLITLAIQNQSELPDRIRLELEEFELQYFKLRPSIWASGMNTISSDSATPISKATTTFKGPAGEYDIAISLPKLKDRAGITLKAGDAQRQIEVRRKQNLQAARVVPLRAIKLRPNDQISVESNFGILALDYLELTSSSEKSDFYTITPATWESELLATFSIRTHQVPYYLLVILFGYTVINALLTGRYTTTPGALMVGFKIVNSRRKNRPPGILEALMRLMAIYLWLPMRILRFLLPVATDPGVERYPGTSLEFLPPTP